MSTEASPATDAPENIDLDVTDVATDQTSNSDAKAADTSDAEKPDAKPEAPASLLDVVKNVVKSADTAPDASSAPKDGQDAPQAADGDEPKEAEDKAEANPPFHTHPRWKEMVEERNALKPDAENYRKITSFMSENNLAPTEVAEGFEIMALLKSGTPENLSKAREYFESRLQSLNETLGVTLPADLRERVDLGHLDEKDARDLAQARARTSLLETNQRQRDERDAEARRSDEARQVQATLVNAVNEWETRIAAKDPDYSTKKAKLVESYSRAIIQETGKVPATAEDAVKLATEAYGRANEYLRSILPRPKPVVPNPVGNSARVSAEPKSLGDAVRNALNR